jgi:hypothetical protein
VSPFSVIDRTSRWIGMVTAFLSIYLSTYWSCADLDIEVRRPSQTPETEIPHQILISKYIMMALSDTVRPMRTWVKNEYPLKSKEAGHGDQVSTAMILGRKSITPQDFVALLSQFKAGLQADSISGAGYLESFEDAIAATGQGL